MTQHENPFRVVRVAPIDLVAGDVVVNIDGEYIGTVETDPVIVAGDVQIPMFHVDDRFTKTVAPNRVFRIEIPRRRS